MKKEEKGGTRPAMMERQKNGKEFLGRVEGGIVPGWTTVAGCSLEDLAIMHCTTARAPPWPTFEGSSAGPAMAEMEDS